MLKKFGVPEDIDPDASMTKEFLQHNSCNGLLLCGVILAWLVASNFLVTMEVPYTAIPLWMLYGVTLVYYRDVKQKPAKT
jgi:hypothetical protein